MKKRFQCRCYSQEFEVERLEDESGWDKDFGDVVDVTIWYCGLGGWDFRRKLAAIWRVIRGESVVREYISLSPDDAARMGQFLLAVSSDKHLDKGDTAPSNTVYVHSHPDRV